VGKGEGSLGDPRAGEEDAHCVGGGGCACRGVQCTFVPWGTVLRVFVKGGCVVGVCVESCWYPGDDSRASG